MLVVTWGTRAGHRQARGDDQGGPGLRGFGALPGAGAQAEAGGELGRGVVEDDNAAVAVDKAGEAAELA